MSLNKWCKDNDEVAERFSRGLDIGQTKHLFIDKDVIYSYGYHFPIAKKYIINNKVVYLFNSNGYSSTTSKHKSYVKSALNGYDILEVNTEFIKALEYDFKDNDYHLNSFKDLVHKEFNNKNDEIKETELKLSRCRTDNKKELYQERINILKVQLDLLTELAIEKGLIVNNL